ncbi:MAG: hypothetical protein ACRDRT_08380 [Pseudonocardiaceae bacterium]
MTRAQLLFSGALGVIFVGISAFAVFVISSTIRAGRWYSRLDRHRRRK